jgi:hypothetical protein
MKKNLLNFLGSVLLMSGMLVSGTGCEKAPVDELSVESNESPAITATGESLPADAVLLAIDESFEKDAAPNFFTELDVNEDIKALGQRATLRYFEQNIGKNINIYTGEVGDEAFHAITSIPLSWMIAGTTGNGARNFLVAGPGLGTGNDPEILLDKVAGVTPLRATGLTMLKGKTILAVVYSSEISVDYNPLLGSLKGDNLGIVAFDVVDVKRRTNGSSNSLPIVTIKVRSVSEASAATLKLFSNPPRLTSSSLPNNINPPATTPTPVFVNAN